jgi:8-oxo-dGTP pyrophosphatase MutT (NUDIX family)
VDLPRDLPLEHRSAVRLVVLDEQGQILLFHTRSPDYPELGTWWEPPGGGIDPGESYVEAAVRELREETGLVADTVGPATWTRTATFKCRGFRRVQEEVVAVARLADAAPAIDVSRTVSRPPTEPQGNVTAASHQPRALRTVRWDATNTVEFEEAG